MFYPLIITFFIVNVVTTALLIIILYNKTRCAYLSNILASFRTFPKLIYASKKLGSRVTAFSKWCIANQISPWAL